MIVRVSKECSELGIFIAHTEVLNLTNGSLHFEEEMQKLETSFDLESLSVDPVVRAYREFYWRLGIDPTKTRPSGEALRRRVARGSKLPRINDIVDAGNIVSVKTLVPIGLYDLSKLVGSPTLVLSKGGERFNPIGSKSETLESGIPILQDERGLVIHVYPHRDALESSVTNSTTSVLVIGAGVPRIERKLVINAVEMVCDLLKRIGGVKTHEIEVS